MRDHATPQVATKQPVIAGARKQHPAWEEVSATQEEEEISKAERAERA